MFVMFFSKRKEYGKKIRQKVKKKNIDNNDGDREFKPVVW